jgi:hypothetical protein
MLFRRFVLAGCLACWGMASSSLAQEPESTYYKAYYLETEEGNFLEAAKLYEQAAGAPGAPADLVEKARKRLDICREEARSGDLPRLMPPGTLAYLEFRSPGKHLARVVEKLGLAGSAAVGSGAMGAPGGESTVPGIPRVSPKLLEALGEMEGGAVSIVNFDPQGSRPETAIEGVAIVKLGRGDLAAGLVETALSSAITSGVLAAGEPVHGHSSYVCPFGTVVLTERLLVAGNPGQLAVEAVERLYSSDAAALHQNEAFASMAGERQESFAFFFADAKALLERAKAEMSRFGGLPYEYQMAQALSDIESLRWIALTLGTCELGITGSLQVRLSEPNHALAYHLFRTPPLRPEALGAVPAGVAAFWGFALSEDKGDSGAGDARAAAPRSLTGLDLGREVFANVREVMTFVLAQPPAQEGPGSPPIFTVKDPARSQALWNTILSVGATVAGARIDPVRTEEMGGRAVGIYAFPESVELYLVTLPDRVVLATSRLAVLESIKAAEGKGTLLNDGAFARIASALTPQTSKIGAVHPGRALQIAGGMHGIPEREVQQIAAVLEGMTPIVFLTEETPSSLKVRCVSGIPQLAPLLPEILGIARHQGPRQAPRRVARSAGGPEDTAPAVRAAPAVPAARVRRVEALRAPSDLPAAEGAVILRGEAAGMVLPAPVETWNPAEVQPLFPKGATWKYWDSGTDPGAAWREPGFDDAAWKSGAAPLGYGEDDLSTTVGFGGDGEAKHMTAYFRASFQVADPAGLRAVRIWLRRDDGAAIYLNGKEIVRDNLPPDAGPGDGSLLTVSRDAEAAFFPHELPPDALRAGDNTLAVEVHQSSGSSSDLIFDLGIEGRIQGEKPSSQNAPPAPEAAPAPQKV